MLISKTVKIKWSGSNRKHYEDKGYIFTKFFEEFEAGIEDLTDSSKALVEARCDCVDCKNAHLKPIRWYSYLGQIEKSGKYYCKKCASKLYGSIKSRNIKLQNGTSFEQWCIDNNRQDILDRWDYELNNYNPSEISFGTTIKPYFKCHMGLHKSEPKRINGFTSGQNGSISCKQCNSFAQWGISNLGDNFLKKYWDYDNNFINPWEIASQSDKKVWIKCQEKDYHGSYEARCYQIVKGQRCPLCSCNSGKVHSLGSFAQWGIDNLGEDFLEKYWSDKNELSPWEISCGSRKKVWIKCQKKDYHENYSLTSAHFTKENGTRCPYCANQKIHPLDSLGQQLENEGLLHIWSEKNKKSPHEYAPVSGQKAWWKCECGKHEDYERIISGSNIVDFRCPSCNISKGEKRIEEYLINNKIEYIPQQPYEGLIGLGGGDLSYDFYLPKSYNLLIEYQGIQHEKPIDFEGKGKKYAEKQFKKQVEHDKRKKEYAKDNKIELLPIWYYDYDNIEEILNNKIKEIHNNIPTETNTYLNT